MKPAIGSTLHARADIQVDLPVPHVERIRMSRPYQFLDALGETEALSPSCLRQILQTMIDSHRDCDSRNAPLRLGFDLLARRPARVSESLAGWKSCPVCFVAYSSTHPYSAALDDDYANARIYVRHLASLHTHDAVAWAGPLREGVIA